MTDDTSIYHPSAYLEAARTGVGRIGGDPEVYVRPLPLNLLKGAAARFCLRPPFMVLAVGVLRISTHCDRNRPGRYQLVGEARQYAPRSERYST